MQSTKGSQVHFLCEERWYIGIWHVLLQCLAFCNQQLCQSLLHPALRNPLVAKVHALQPQWHKLTTLQFVTYAATFSTSVYSTASTCNKLKQGICWRTMSPHCICHNLPRYFSVPIWRHCHTADQHVSNLDYSIPHILTYTCWQLVDCCSWVHEVVPMFDTQIGENISHTLISWCNCQAASKLWCASGSWKLQCTDTNKSCLPYNFILQRWCPGKLACPVLAFNVYGRYWVQQISPLCNTTMPLGHDSCDNWASEPLAQVFDITVRTTWLSCSGPEFSGSRFRVMGLQATAWLSIPPAVVTNKKWW